MSGHDCMWALLNHDFQNDRTYTKLITNRHIKDYSKTALIGCLQGITRDKLIPRML